jgi:hypothetical protein
MQLASACRSTCLLAEVLAELLHAEEHIDCNGKPLLSGRRAAKMPAN